MAADNKSLDALSAEIQGLKETMAEVKGLITSLQTIFVRTDIYTLQHTELVSKVAKLEKDSADFQSTLDQAEGAIKTLRVISGLLGLICAVLAIILTIKWH